jgi:hypothetical protein
MSAIASAPVATETPEVEHAPGGLFGWVVTVDHKRIGILNLLTALVFLS